MQSFADILASPIAPLPAHPAGGASAQATITADWLQGKAAFGGLQGALGTLAMRAAVGSDLPLRALQMTFISAVEPGAVEARAEVVRRGRAITHAQCRLTRDDQVVALMVGLFGAARESVVQVDLPMPSDVKPIASLPEAPFIANRMPGFMQYYQMRWAGGARPFSGSPLRPARAWARLREAATEGERPAAILDTPTAREANLVTIADLPASPALSLLTQPAPGASLTWLLEFLVDPRSVDPRTWLLMQTETRHAGAGYTSQTAHLWDEHGRAIAVSHQTTAVFG